MQAVIRNTGLPRNEALVVEADYANFLEHINDYYPSGEDVMKTRRLLRMLLPPELVNIVIEEARYLPRLVFHNNQYHNLRSAINKHDASWHYLVMPPIPPPAKNEEGQDVHMKIREVVFWFRSCDQGWTTDPPVKGRYDASRTWFEACIYRHLPENAPEDRQVIILRNNILAPGSDALHAAGIERVTNVTTGKDVWKVQSNLRACAEVTLHKVRWTPEPPASLEDYRKTGAEMGHGFVRSLRTGDVIAIISRAKNIRWENNVYEVAVEVHFSL